MAPSTSNAGGVLARLVRDVAPGIHRIEHGYTNCYLVDDGAQLTIIDAGFPSTWGPLLRALKTIGRRPSDIRRLVLTHGHFDHLGFAARIAHELDVPISIHVADADLAAHPYRYARERSPLGYPLRYPRAVPLVAAMARAGALAVPGVTVADVLPTTAGCRFPASPR